MMVNSFDRKKKHTTMTVVPSELSDKKNLEDRDDRHKWGSLYTPANPPPVLSSLHYPASETPMATTTVVPKKNSWTGQQLSPTPAAPFFSLSSLFSNLRSSSAARRRPSPGTQPSKNESTRRSQNHRNNNVRDGDEFTPSSQVALLNRPNSARPPRPPHHLNPPLQQQQQQQQQRQCEDKKERKRRRRRTTTTSASTAAAAAEARSAARWRKQRAAHHGRVSKKTAPPRTRRVMISPKPITTTTTTTTTTSAATRRRRTGAAPRAGAPVNSTQMLMHLYHRATAAATKRDERNTRRNKTTKNVRNVQSVQSESCGGVRPLSSLASPRLDSTPVRLAGASSIGNLLRGHIDTFGTLLRSPGLRHPRRPLIGGCDGVGVVTPPFSPIEGDVDMHDIDTFGSHLDDRDSCRSSSGKETSEIDELGRLERTPLRRSLSNFSNATTNSTWLGDYNDVDGGGGGVEEAEEEEEEDEEEKTKDEGFAPSVLTSPVAWTPASPAPHRR